MITLPLSFATEADVLAAYREAGGTIGDVVATVSATSTIVDCSGTPPTFFDGWTYRPTDQLPNLYKGVVDMSEIVAAQAPSQQQGYTRLDVIQRELQDCEFVGAHAAEWYLRPENKDAFLAVCPSGYLVFLEKYRRAVRNLGVVFLYVHGGRVCVADGYALVDRVFDARGRFAVRRKLNA